jgi:uncharacterized membrane protein YbhN (UPF0104 family)
VAVLGVIFSRVAVDEILARAGAGSPIPLVLVTALSLVCFVLAALRWRLMAGQLGVAIPVGTAIRAQLVAMFGGQVLPSAVGIDVLRGWALAPHTQGLSGVVSSLIADRLVALFAACLLALPALAGLLGAPLLASWLHPSWLASLFGPAAVVGSGGALTIFFLLARRGEGVRLSAGPIATGVVLAVAVHATVVLMASLAASAYRVDASLVLWLSVIPASVIVSSIPVSLNGWGVREATIVVLSAPLGLPAEEALLVSVTLGALNLVASLPGALVFLKARGRGLA